MQFGSSATEQLAPHEDALKMGQMAACQAPSLRRVGGEGLADDFPMTWTPLQSQIKELEHRVARNGPRNSCRFTLLLSLLAITQVIQVSNLSGPCHLAKLPTTGVANWAIWFLIGNDDTWSIFGSPQKDEFLLLVVFSHLVSCFLRLLSKNIPKT